MRFSAAEAKRPSRPNGGATHRSNNLQCCGLSTFFDARVSNCFDSVGIVGAPDIPFDIIILPYKLARGKSGRLIPSTKKDVERAEKMGIQLVALIKACLFASRMESVVEDPKYNNKTWSSTNLLVAMHLSNDAAVEEYKN